MQIVSWFLLLGNGGYPGTNVPAGYDKNGGPYGITFGSLKGSETTNRYCLWIQKSY